MLMRLVLLGASTFVVLAASVAVADSPPAGEGAFRVLVEDQAGADGLGVFAATDVAGGDVLETRGPGDAYSSYVTVRSYTTGTDYVQTSALPASGFAVVPLEPYGSVLSVEDGWRSFYSLPASSPSGEALSVIADVTAAGPNLSVAAEVSNQGDAEMQVGVRFLLDVSLDGDTGPALRLQGDTSTVESSARPGQSLQIVAETGRSLSVLDDGQADAVAFGHWDRAFQTAFDYTPDGTDIASPAGLNDSALLYYFGSTEDTALTLAPGESLRVAVAMSEIAAETPSAEASPTGPAETATSIPGPTDGPAPVSRTPAGGKLPNTGGKVLGVEDNLAIGLGALGVVLVAVGMTAVRLARGPRKSP